MTDQDPTQRYDSQTPGQAPPSPPATGVVGPPPFAPAVPPGPLTSPAPTAAGAPPVYEPAQAGVAVAEPVVPVAPPARPGRGWLRWMVALVVVVLAAGGAVAATRLLTSDSAGADVLAWTPAERVMYAELRLDLPGDQQAEMAELMAAFPGFDDQAAFPTKLNEALDLLLSRSSDGKVSYQADIAPWFGGQLAWSVGALPGPSDPLDVEVLVLASTKDPAAAGAWAAAMAAAAGETTATETYGDVTITTVNPDVDVDIANVPQFGYAVYGPVLAFGDTASLKASIDTGGKTGLDTDAQFVEATAGVTGDRLGLQYMETAEIMKASAAMSGGGGSESALSTAFLDQLPPWTVAVLRAEDSALVADMHQPHVATTSARAGESTIPSLVPPDTLVLVDVHDFGSIVLESADRLAREPLIADGMQELDEALAIVGGLDAIAGWMGETAIVLTPDGDPVGGGVVIVPTDKAAGERLLTQLRGFLQLAGGGTGISVSDEAYGNATITTVTVDGAALGDMSAFAGPVSSISIAYAVTDQAIVLGYGADFVKGVIDAATGESLADTARFKDTLARADAANIALLWIDIAGVRTLAESLAQPLAPADPWSQYESEIKPYVEPFDVMISTSAPGDEIDTWTMVITVVGR